MTPRPPQRAQTKPRPPHSKKLLLRLYVAGGSPNSLAAIANLKALEARSPTVTFELQIVDILQDPSRALSDAVLMTPTLLKLSPAPTCRILGNLRDLGLVLRSLGLPE